MDKYLDTVTALFDILFNNESSPEFSVYKQLYRKLSKDYLKLQSEKRTLLTQNFPNIFQQVYGRVVMDGTVEEQLNNAAALLSGDARPLYQFSNLSNRYRQTIFTHDHDYVYIILYCICNPAFPSRYTVSCLTLFTNYDAKSTGFFILLMIV